MALKDRVLDRLHDIQLQQVRPCRGHQGKWQISTARTIIPYRGRTVLEPVISFEIPCSFHMETEGMAPKCGMTLNEDLDHCGSRALAPSRNLPEGF